jgi:hypothetical protein
VWIELANKEESIFVMVSNLKESGLSSGIGKQPTIY